MTSSQSPPAVRVFGGMGIEGDDGPVSIGGPRQRKLLALLSLRAGSVCGTDWLAEHLWDDGDRPEKPASAIRTYMSRLRQALPGDAQLWLRTEPAGYVFDAPAVALEHRRFTDLQAQARGARGQGDPLAAMTLLDEALALWRGAPFHELEDSGVARATVEQLHLDRLEMLEERWESALALGRHTQITGELAVFTTEHRLRDRATRQYALALHRSGRTAEALRLMVDHRQFLADESGLDPSAEMAELEQAMLAGDESLQVEKVGRPLRGYRLLDEIGSGAFSVVWRAMQPSVGREVAIKQIRSELASQPEFIRRFEAEAHLIARIEHPHIVPLIDFWRDPDSAYLVMRLLRGATLERRLDDGPLTVDETLTLARQIGGALSAAHAHGIIHRDVKTGNIMFDESGNAFLGDFGIALEATESTGAAAAFSTGSPAYSAPEQIRREPLGPQADVFSLGVVLYECITGSLPFTDSKSVAVLVERQLDTDYPAVTDLRPDVPRQFADAIAKATAKNPNDRFESVGGFIDALDPAGEAQDATHEVVVGVATNLPNPYLGLSAFDEADRDNFFGREALVSTLLKRLKGTGLASRCIGVIGSSGSGKSSVVRAGLSPAVRMGAVPGSDRWFATTMVPGVNAFESLEAALLRIAVNPPDSLLAQMQDGPRGLLRCLRRCLSEDTNKIYLVIDQFEEVFTSGKSEMASDFLNALAVAVEDPQSPLRLVFTLRADYFGHPLEHPTFARILDTTSVNVTPLTADELERAMVEPAKRLGVGFEPGLVALIVADCIGQPAPLPLLQYALSELFERRDGGLLTVAAYKDMGRLTGALAGQAEAIHDRATETQQLAIRRAFGRMINPAEEAADLRRRARVQDLGHDLDTAWVLEQFGNARLVTFDRDPSSREPTVEVAHEALLREWPRLSAWLNEDRDLLRSSETVALAADEWVASGRPEADLYRGARLENAIALTTGAPDRLRTVDAEFIAASERLAETEHAIEERRGRRLRQLLVGVGTALIIALIAGGVAFSQRGRANDQADLAETQAVLADEQAQLAQDSAREAETQAAFADEQTLIAKGAAEEAAAQAELADQQATLAVEAATRAELATLISQSEAVAVDDEELSILLALEAHRRDPGSATEQVVFRAFTSSTLVNRVSILPRLEDKRQVGCAITVDVGAQTLFAQRDDQLISQDTTTGTITEHGPAPGPCVQWFGDPDADRRVAFSRDGELWFAPYDGPWVLQPDFVTPSIFGVTTEFNPAHRLLLGIAQDELVEVIVVDDRTGQVVGTPISGPDRGTWVAMSPDGAFGVVGFGGESEDEPGELVILDGETGAELSRSVGIRPVTFGFGPAANEVFVGTDDGSVVIVDLPSGDIISALDTSATTRLLNIGVRSDDTIVVTSTNQAEVIDRETGPTGERIELTERNGASLRDDGTLFTQNAELTHFETFTLDAIAVAKDTIEISEPGHAIFSNGSAVVINDVTQLVESIDLTTGVRIPLPLFTPEGDPFETHIVTRQSDGYLAISRDAQITRWEDGVMVERITPWGDISSKPVLVTFGDGVLLLGAVIDGNFSNIELRSFNTNPGELRQLATIAATDVIDMAIDQTGSIHVWSSDGTIRTFDQNGVAVGELETGLRTLAGRLSGAAISEHHLAFGSSGGGFIVERATGEVTQLPALVGAINSLDFARNGSILVVASEDGTVRTWDVAEKAFRDVLWRGTPATQFGLWVDDTTDSAWIADGKRLVNLPLTSDDMLVRACEVVGRDLTQEEWDLYVPGDEPLQSACG